MNFRVGVCLVLLCAWGAFAQGKNEPAEQARGGAAVAALDGMRPVEKLAPARPANSNTTYQALRARTPNGAIFAVKGLTLKRDAGVFRFSDGTFFLLSDVNGMTTGAVFLGEGTLHVEPPSAMERKQLKMVMKTEVLEQQFTTALLEFTDGTAEEIKKGGTHGTPARASEAVGVLQQAQTLFRKSLRYDIEERLLEDVGKKDGGEFFLADVKGPMLSKRLIFVVDPHGAIGVQPEEVALLISADDGYDIALGFRSAAHGGLAQAKTNKAFAIPRQSIEVTIDKGGKMDGTAVTAITAREDGVQTLPLMLFPTLRVSGVWGPKGEALDFIQENKDLDADFAVVLSKPLASGETIEITTQYSGKDAVTSEGNWNYNLVAREDWYPNVRNGLGNYATYRMTFHTPKGVDIIATGNKVSQADEGSGRTTVWETTMPIAVAGFNMGMFKSNASEKYDKTQVVSYANTGLANRYEQLTASPTMGSLSTTKMLKLATSEGEVAVKIYTDYFGPLPYDHVSLTQQTACNYGQSWPTLVYLPICYFWDSTVLFQLGLMGRDSSYWNVVTAHEVAHQWWAQTVGFESYRDQWMSEGFADFSASLFLLETRKDQKDFRDFWTEQRRRLLEKNNAGVRPVDVGPVVMGARVDTSKSGQDVYQSLIYPKGAYILQMLHSLYWTPQYGEGPFKKAMQDFVSTYKNKPATTEDFKAVMERDMPQWLDLDKNHKLDWFFNDYVYGTEVPKYSITAEFSKNGDATVAHIKLTQSGVSDNFKMLVPLYLEMPDKQVMMIGRATMNGSKTIEENLNLGKLPTTPVKMMANYYYDVLSE